jgi:hypothetical protein
LLVENKVKPHPQLIAFVAGGRLLLQHLKIQSPTRQQSEELFSNICSTWLSQIVKSYERARNYYNVIKHSRNSFGIEFWQGICCSGAYIVITTPRRRRR